MLEEDKHCVAYTSFCYSNAAVRRETRVDEKKNIRNNQADGFRKIHC